MTSSQARTRSHAGRRCGALLAALIAGALGGCEPELTDAGIAPQVVPDVIALDAAATDDADDALAQAPTDDLTGTWALATDWSTCVNVIGRFQETRLRTLTRVEVTQRGPRVYEVRDTCSSASTPVLGLETLIPRAAVEAGNPMFVESMFYGGRYLSGVEAQIWGIDLERPVEEGLPGRGDLPDERIYDADGDGNPGVTFTAGGDLCFMYTIQRTISSVQGQLASDGLVIEGSGQVLTGQTVLEATSSFCDTQWDVISNDDHNVARMVRVDALGLDLDADADGTVSCEEIIAAEEALIAWQPVDEGRCARGR